ncbi:hypothetical protein M422DRAFT_67097 [Sphaerobolus stellatus SS14]|uniref:EamA domain-containing protein n=1 Tax=Sphaerobolus stellatus (strain SS14) TaxID=990650 RepID=A0A0C9W3B8_SPHS4|nr:hypothetical protein M422DRAFT_67097 [Sphaerobolus stellatus SS14]
MVAFHETDDSPQLNDTRHVTSKVARVLRTTRQYIAGLLLLSIVVVLWTLSNFVTQALFINGYHKPFLVTYLNTSSFAFYLIPSAIRYYYKRRQDDKGNGPNREQYAPLPTSSALEIASSAPPGPVEPSSDYTDLPPLTTTETAQLASIFCFFWFIANWSLNAALDYTWVASATILSATSGFFTLGIGRFFKVESLTLLKVIAVFTSFVGVLLVSLSDGSAIPGDAPLDPSNPAPRPVFGDILAILSAVFYALYVILLKVRIGSESRINMQLFFGFVGAFNIIALVPVGFLLHITGYEPFNLPSTRNEWGAVVINMFITLSSDYIYVLAMLKTTPLVVTVGLSLTIPLAILGDQFLNIPTRGQAIFGAFLVLGSFVLVGWEDRDPASPKGDLENVDVASRELESERETQ